MMAFICVCFELNYVELKRAINFCTDFFYTFELNRVELKLRELCCCFIRISLRIEPCGIETAKELQYFEQCYSFELNRVELRLVNIDQIGMLIHPSNWTVWNWGNSFILKYPKFLIFRIEPCGIETCGVISQIIPLDSSNWTVWNWDSESRKFNSIVFSASNWTVWNCDLKELSEHERYLLRLRIEPCGIETYFHPQHHQLYTYFELNRVELRLVA